MTGAIGLIGLNSALLAQKSILFDCDIYYNHKILDEAGGSIYVKLDSTNLTKANGYGESVYSRDTFKSIKLVADAALSLNTKNMNLFFEYRKPLNGCISKDIKYIIDSSRNTADALYITKFEINDHYFNYPQDSFCITQESAIKPITNIPLVDVTPWSMSPGLFFDQGRNLLPAKSLAGRYTLEVKTNYCIANKYGSMVVVIENPFDIALPETLKYCSNGLNAGMAYSKYDFFTDKTVTPTPDKEVVSGFRTIYSKKPACRSASHSVFIEVIEPEKIEITQEALCEKVVLNVSSMNTNPTNWSNGIAGKTIEVAQDQKVKVESIDSRGCISMDSTEVFIRPLNVEQIEYKTIEANCWEEGRIDISDIVVKNASGGHKYNLKNTVNNKVVENLNDVPEGIYKIEVVDSRNCVSLYNEQVVIKQKCLENYPVFTPDDDGVEDEYFISYAGYIKIYDRNGSIKRQMNTPAYWDGKDATGNLLPMGNYVMVTDKGKPVNITIVR